MANLSSKKKDKTPKQKAKKEDEKQKGKTKKKGIERFQRNKEKNELIDLVQYVWRQKEKNYLCVWRKKKVKKLEPKKSEDKKMKNLRR